MTPHEAFDKWWAESPSMLAQDAFIAGWEARGNEDMPRILPLDLDAALANAGIAQLAEQAVCSGQVAGSTPAAGSITAEDIYKAYPRHVGKAAAIKAIKKAIKTVEVIDGCDDFSRSSDPRSDYLMFKTKLYAAAVAKWPDEEKKYVPHPATWFNRGSYDDDPQEWVKGTAAQTSQFRVHH